MLAEWLSRRIAVLVFAVLLTAATVWDNLGGIIKLIDDQGKVIDEYEYGWWMGS